MASRPLSHTLSTALAEHLSWWGLRRFTSDAPYFEWQRSILSVQDIADVNRLLEVKRVSGEDADEVAFYDFSVQPDILRALYSERYDYYLAVGVAVADRLTEGHRVLDFGCGPGILTTFYARQFPNCTFLGVDRSKTCIDVAKDKAAALRLTNVRFQCLNVSNAPLSEEYDRIIATQVLLQAEKDPGVPSLSWQTFERAKDHGGQSAFEERTALKLRLERLCAALAPHGCLILFEKTRHLARRVPFQRALSAFHLRLLEPPLPLRYRLVEEVVDDGPLYVLSRSSDLQTSDSALDWDESPEVSPDQELYRRSGAAAQTVWQRLPDRVVIEKAERHDQRLGNTRIERGTAGKILSYLHISAENHFDGILVGGPGAAALLESCYAGISRPDEKDSMQFDAFLQRMWGGLGPQEEPLDTPLYENHTCAAQGLWTSLPNRHVLQETTDQGPDGRQLHIELGTTGGFAYLYCANTFDQRQLVLVDHTRRTLIEDYYKELLVRQ